MNKMETQATSSDLPLFPIVQEILKANETWPLSLFNFVLFDSMGLRLWVDKSEATPIVLKVFTLFGKVRIPSENLFGAMSEGQGSFIKDAPREVSS